MCFVGRSILYSPKIHSSSSQLFSYLNLPAASICSFCSHLILLLLTFPIKSVFRIMSTPGGIIFSGGGNVAHCCSIVTDDVCHIRNEIRTPIFVENIISAFFNQLIHNSGGTQLNEKKVFPFSREWPNLHRYSTLEFLLFLPT